MKLFVLFGTATFIYSTILSTAVLAFVNKRAGRSWSYGLRNWVLRSFIASFGYAGFIFLVEGEGPGIADQNDSIIEIYQNGLLMYLYIFNFILVIPLTIGFLLWAEKQPKQLNQKAARKKQ